MLRIEVDGMRDEFARPPKVPRGVLGGRNNWVMKTSMLNRAIPIATIVALLLPAATAYAQWKHAERIETYAVSGTTGIELYRSIGEKGPKAGAARAIAFTTYELTWTRDYRPEAGGCTLKTARPKLTIVYKWPKPAEKLPPATQALWSRFIAGIEKHERVHGDIILETVRKIEAETLGLTVPADKGCKAIRAEVQRRIADLAADMRAQGAAFDKTEMNAAGNVHGLVLGLVNGG